jgi:hypothetical protein
MFNNSGNKICELPESHTSSSDWGQFRRSVLFPPLINCNLTDYQKVSSPLATNAYGGIRNSTELSCTQKNVPYVMIQEEKENSIYDNISLSERHRLQFPVNNNRQFNNHNQKKLKSCSKNTTAGNISHSRSSRDHHKYNNMKFRDLLSNISKAVGGNNCNSPPSTSTAYSQHKGKTI